MRVDGGVVGPPVGLGVKRVGSHHCEGGAHRQRGSRFVGRYFWFSAHLYFVEVCRQGSMAFLSNGGGEGEQQNEKGRHPLLPGTHST